MREIFDRNEPLGVFSRKKNTTRRAATPEIGMFRSANASGTLSYCCEQLTEQPTPLPRLCELAANKRSECAGYRPRPSDRFQPRNPVNEEVTTHKPMSALYIARSRNETRSDTMIIVTDWMAPPPAPSIAKRQREYKVSGTDEWLTPPNYQPMHVLRCATQNGAE